MVEHARHAARAALAAAAAAAPAAAAVVVAVVAAAAVAIPCQRPQQLVGAPLRGHGVRAVAMQHLQRDEPAARAVRSLVGRRRGATAKRPQQHEAAVRRGIRQAPVVDHGRGRAPGKPDRGRGRGYAPPVRARAVGERQRDRERV
jgi:hypothetical protein